MDAKLTLGVPFSAPDQHEAAALAVVATYLQRVGCEVGSRLLGLPPATANAAMLGDLRYSVLAAAALCAVIVDVDTETAPTPTPPPSAGEELLPT